VAVTVAVTVTVTVAVTVTVTVTVAQTNHRRGANRPALDLDWSHGGLRTRGRVVIVVPTPLPGLILLELAARDDARGRLVEIYRRDRYEAAGIAATFVQDNATSTVGGALRGLHYQRQRPQGKLVYATAGEVFDVAVDVRRGSPSLGAWFGTVLSADNRRQLWIPPGFAHGFLALSPRADLVYKLTDYHAPDDEHAIRWDDPALAIAWPVAPRVMSARDAAAPGLHDAELPA